MDEARVPVDTRGFCTRQLHADRTARRLRFGLGDKSAPACRVRRHPGIREASSMVPCGQSRGPHAGAIGAILPTMTWTLNSATHTGLQGVLALSQDRDPQGE